jgi:hypothetical protein
VDGTALIRLRADVGRRRDKIGKEPSDPICHAYATEDSKLVLHARGKVPLGEGTVAWKGDAEYWGIKRPGDTRGLIAYLKVDADASHREGWSGLQLDERSSPLIEEICGKGCITNAIPALASSTVREGPESFTNPIKYGPVMRLPALKIHFGKDYSIASGTYPSPAHPEYLGAKELFVRLAWDPVQALSPPEADKMLDAQRLIAAIAALKADARIRSRMGMAMTPEQATQQMGRGAAAAGIDMVRMQNDPAYAQQMQAAMYGAASQELGNPTHIAVLDRSIANDIQVLATRLEEIVKRAALVTHCGLKVLANPGSCHSNQ